MSPPDSLGGKELLLTCRGCNGKAGGNIDFEAKKRKAHDNLHDIIFGRDRCNEVKGAVLEIPGVHLRIELSRSNGMTLIKPLGGRANPIDVIEQFKTLFAAQAQFKVKKVFNYDPRLANVSDLKSAFLLITAWLGYGYAFNSRLAIVREQILNPEEKLLGSKFVINTNDGEKLSESIIVVESPVPCFAVTFGLRAIILPSPDSPWNLYDLVGDFLEEGRVTFSGNEYPWPSGPLMLLDFVG